MKSEKIKESNFLDIKYIYNVSQGNLLNGAKKFKDYNFVSYIGGVNEGISEIIVKVSDSCIYYLLLKYISYESNLSFKINVNNIESTKIYYTDFSSKWSINNPSTFTIPILLNRGNNIIKFYGNENKNAPYLGEFLLALPKVTNYLSEGVLENNAYVDINSAFVNAIGGPKDGSTIVTVNTSNKGNYNLIFNYLCGDVSRPLKIHINKIDGNYIYNIPPTESWDKNSIKTFTVPIVLNLGNNTIKFHGDGVNYGPNLGSILIESRNDPLTAIYTMSKVYKFSHGILANGALIDKATNVITKIGGIDDGYAIMKISIDTLGDYLIKLNYTNGNRNLKIDINGIESDTVYNFSNKSGMFSITLPLVVGINQLKFHGDGKDYAPDLNDFTIELIKDTSSVILNGVVSNKASILPKGVITGIGTINDGRYMIKFKANDFGWYDLYLTLDTTKGTILALDINFDVQDLVYNIPKSDEVIVYIIPFLLKKGINTIVFHGDYKSNAPDILKTEIKLNTPIQDYNYKFVNGFLENGAKINFQEEVVENIGGMNNGSVTIEVNINMEGYYDLNILYIGESISKPLKIDIINNKIISSTTTYRLPPADYKYDFQLQSFKVTLPLTKGLNNIKFYGNGINNSPKLKEFQILESIKKEDELFSKTYKLTESSLYSGAKAHKSVDGFIENLGGKLEGSALLKVRVPRAAEYKIEVKYLKVNDNEKFALIVDKIFDGNLIDCPKTNSLRKEDAKTITINMFLKEHCILEFYGSKKFGAPLLGDITITENKLTLSTPYKINSIDYYNGARLYNEFDFITLIGGPKNGRIELTLDILKDGFYDLGFKYICAFNVRTLNIDVNEQEYTNSYKLPLTQNWDILNAQTFTIPLKLKKGTNIVLFKGNESEFSPIIGKFNLAINKILVGITYETSTGILKNGAKINNYGLVTNIGGPKKGEVLVKVNAKYEGKYTLTVQYKPIYGNPNLEIIINNNVYYLEKEKDSGDWSLMDMPTLKTIVYLFSGENIINFRGLSLNEEKVNYAPFLGSFNLIKYDNNYNIEKNLPKGSYDLTKGKLENGANVFQDFVIDIGGYNNGSVTINVNINKTANYFMTINYISLENSYLLFDVNGEENGNIYFFQATNCSNNEEEFQIKLKEGNNIIKFYGIKNVVAPRISIISIRKII